MFKKLNYTKFLIFLSFNYFTYAQSDVIFLEKNCMDNNLKNVSTFLQQNSNIYIDSVSEIIGSKNMLEYPVIIICGDNYLKLNDKQINIIKEHVVFGNLLIIDNYKSDYTFTIFLEKILPDYTISSLSNDKIFKNYYEINFENIAFDTKQIFINQQLRVIGIKSRSILREVENLEIDNIKFLSSIILNFLLGG